MARVLADGLVAPRQRDDLREDGEADREAEKERPAREAGGLSPDEVEDGEPDPDAECPEDLEGLAIPESRVALENRRQKEPPGEPGSERHGS